MLALAGVLDEAAHQPGSEESRRPGECRLWERLDLGHAGSHIVVKSASVGTPPEGLDRGQEGAERAAGVGQAALMGDQFRQLENEPKVRGGLLGPRLTVPGMGVA